MTTETIIIGLAGVLAAAAPVIFATIGETLSERAGVINLSLNGTILLAAMSGFAVAVKTEDLQLGSISLLLGCLTGMLVGALVALVVAFASITLHQSQVAVGFVLALMCRDLAYFLGNPIMGLAGPRIPSFAIPGLSQIPIIGPSPVSPGYLNLSELSGYHRSLGVDLSHTRWSDSPGHRGTTSSIFRARRQCQPHALFLYHPRRCTGWFSRSCILIKR